MHNRYYLALRSHAKPDNASVIMYHFLRKRGRFIKQKRGCKGQEPRRALLYGLPMCAAAAGHQCRASCNRQHLATRKRAKIDSAELTVAVVFMAVPSGTAMPWPLTLPPKAAPRGAASSLRGDTIARTSGGGSKAPDRPALGRRECVGVSYPLGGGLG